MPHHERRRSYRPCCESLGDRVLLSATPTAQIVKGTLFVTGTEQADVINVTIRPHRVGRGIIPVVRVSGVPRAFPATRFKMVVVDARGGDDRVTIDDGGRPMLPTWIDGGDGNDTLIGGSANDTIIGGPGDDVIEGRGGHNVIIAGPGRNVVDGVADPLPPPEPTPPPAEPAAPPTPVSGPAADPIPLPTITLPPPRASVPTPARPDPSTPVVLNQDERTLVERTNQARTEAGLTPLISDPRLQRAAQIQAANMARLNRIAHDLPETETPTLADRGKAAGYAYSRLGENLAFNYFTPSQAIDGWLNSSGHRRNILDPEYTEIGVAIAHNALGQPYYVQVFGRPMA